jgi:hypothetical protein
VDAKRQQKQAQYCYDLRKNYSKKWDTLGSKEWFKHQVQLKQVRERIINAVKKIIQNCEEECL